MEQRDPHIHSTIWEPKNEGKYDIELPDLDAAAESLGEGFHIRTGSNIGEEVLSDYRLGVELGEPSLGCVVREDDSGLVYTDRSEWQTIKLVRGEVAEFAYPRDDGMDITGRRGGLCHSTKRYPA